MVGGRGRDWSQSWRTGAVWPGPAAPLVDSRLEGRLGFLGGPLPVCLSRNRLALKLASLWILTD